MDAPATGRRHHTGLEIGRSGEEACVIGRAVIVVVSGPPGAGKSALAERLRERHGWTVLAKDTIKEALFDTLGTGDRTWSRSLSDASYELMFRLAGQALGREPVLVLEGNFRTEHRLRISRLAATRRAALLDVGLRADREVLRQRLEARAVDPDRHPGHLDRELIAEVDLSQWPESGDIERAAGDDSMASWRRLEFDTRELDQSMLDRTALHVSQVVAFMISTA